jgi:hypothetical protein
MRSRRGDRGRAAGLIVLAASALLVFPADAAKAKDWVRVEIPCATGGNVAVVGYSPTHPWWGPSDEDGAADLNPKGWASWYKNPCKGQWLTLDTRNGDPSEDSNTTWSIGTGRSGRIGGATGGRLMNAPVCDVNGADRVIIAKPKQAAKACADE